MNSTRRRILRKSPFICLLALASAGCASAPDSDASLDTEGAITGHPATLEMHLTIAESKLVYSATVQSFSVGDGGATTLDCFDRVFSLTSKPSLHATAWSLAQASAFAEDVPGAISRNYVYVACRDATAQITGWFTKEREYPFAVSETVVRKDYDATKQPVVLQLTSFGSTAKYYYSCRTGFKKVKTGETSSATKYDVTTTCTPRPAPTAAELGTVDFVANPGPYAALASYRSWDLPALAPTTANFDKIRAGLLNKVPAGKFSGAMSTLSKTCGLSVSVGPDSLVIDHTTTSSGRIRHLDLRAADLLGYVEGDVFVDPIRVGGPKQGTFAAAEFRDAKGAPVVVRFEQNSAADPRAATDGQVVRINGSDSYCRRLVKTPQRPIPPGDALEVP